MTAGRLEDNVCYSIFRMIPGYFISTVLRQNGTLSIKFPDCRVEARMHDANDAGWNNALAAFSAWTHNGTTPRTVPGETPGEVFRGIRMPFAIRRAGSPVTVSSGIRDGRTC